MTKKPLRINDTTVLVSESESGPKIRIDVLSQPIDPLEALLLGHALVIIGRRLVASEEQKADAR